MQLNRRALHVVEQLETRAIELRVEVVRSRKGARLIDVGARTRGGLRAGQLLSRICMADLAEVRFQEGEWGPEVLVATDDPAAACLASQYAGWRLHAESFFGMGSGPMRAASGQEDLFERIGFREKAEHVVGVIETRQKPTDDIIDRIAEACHVGPEELTLLFAPTASLAGAIQIVARSLETAMHKLFVLGFDCLQVAAGMGMAPLPPVGGNDLAMIGKTNDAILYGSRVTLWLQTTDETIAKIGPLLPSKSSPEHGRPFAELFAKVNHDFYAIDPMLFSPAQITLVNLESGKAHTFGQLEPQILRHSFWST